MFLKGLNPKQTKKINRFVGIVSFCTVLYRICFTLGKGSHHTPPSTLRRDRPTKPRSTLWQTSLRSIASIVAYSLLFYQHQSLPKISQSNSTILLGIAVLECCSLPVFSLKTLVILVVAWNVVNTLNLLKIAQEHGGELANEPLPIMRSRTYFYFYPLQMLCSPFFINYHFEHHANFNVPWYRLPEYHRAILNIVPEELRPYYFHREYRKQMNGQKPVPNKELLASK